MKKRLVFILSLVLFLHSCQDSSTSDPQSFPTVFEESNGLETATYQETIDFYLQLSKSFSSINVQTIGMTDSGEPLHLVTFNPDGNFNFQKISENKRTILINNGIHPGESDGIDATMMLFRDLAQNTLDVPKNVVVATIAVYNVGGALNRNSTSRVNQNGPKSYGFRGNARNYDLNRDFVKMDTENAKTFASIFHLVKPTLFVDNHVSNGADYQYVLTHLFTQHNKLGGAMGKYVNESLMPRLEEKLAQQRWDITPYVNVFNRPPDNGFSQFMDHPRYSTGYTALWNIPGLMVETHMLKPYQQRVEGTYELMKNAIQIVDEDHAELVQLQVQTAAVAKSLTHYPINWQLDTTKVSQLKFKGFVADTVISEITGLPRLRYDVNRPFTKVIPYKNQFHAMDSVKIPEAYIIKKSWKRVIERLAVNNIQLFELKSDTTLSVEGYQISSYKSYSRPYEGHYTHYDTEVTASDMEIDFQKGDVLVPTRQEGLRYLIEMLEPEAVDSFFNWNFFDTVLQQKEGFSPYVFEDLALRIFEENPNLKIEFEAKKASDGAFSKDWYQQLSWIYKNSKYRESAFMHYPVYRLNEYNAAGLGLED